MSQLCHFNYSDEDEDEDKDKDKDKDKFQRFCRYHQTRLDLSVQVDTEDSEPRVRKTILNKKNIKEITVICFYTW